MLYVFGSLLYASIALGRFIDRDVMRASSEKASCRDRAIMHAQHCIEHHTILFSCGEATSSMGLVDGLFTLELGPSEMIQTPRFANRHAGLADPLDYSIDLVARQGARQCMRLGVGAQAYQLLPENGKCALEVHTQSFHHSHVLDC